MTRCIGIKLSHDAAVAAIENGRLLFSVELEKIDNNARYSKAESWADVERVLEREGVRLSSDDRISIDGWNNAFVKPPFSLGVAPYHDGDLAAGGRPWGDPLFSRAVSIELQGQRLIANSYPHATGHIIGSYVMSPFAHDGQTAHVVAFDGGMSPRIYRVDPTRKAIDFIEAPLPFTGLLYGIMGYYFGPYMRPEVAGRDDLPEPKEELFGTREWPGKLMSWFDPAEAREELIRVALDEIDVLQRDEARLPLRERLSFRKTGKPEHIICRAVDEAATRIFARDAEALASIHVAVQRALITALRYHIPPGSNLVFTGGSALNIKWNSALRASNHFADVFVPPCPNDSGSAIGAAAANAWAREGLTKLEWSVYSGPKLLPSDPEPGWSARYCSLSDLARILAAEPEEPVCFLYDRAEIGPRALGHRSLLMSPESPRGKDILNAVKKREPWRPVAPIALESAAAESFVPGTPDPFMLFDHHVTEETKRHSPAIVHDDGSARLQTVADSGRDCAVVSSLLREFAAVSGRPAILCNTSANLNGSGFFPDAASAMRWGGVRRVWADWMLFEKEGE